jgi:hypothetical protein
VGRLVGRFVVVYSHYFTATIPIYGSMCVYIDVASEVKSLTSGGTAGILIISSTTCCESQRNVGAPLGSCFRW